MDERRWGGGAVSTSQQEFLQDWGVLEKKIKECNRNAARDTSGNHLSYGEALSLEVRGHLSEQEWDDIIEHGAPYTTTTTTPAPADDN